MKKRFFSTLVSLVLVISVPANLLSETTKCECGEHATGITTYNVDGPSCCLSSTVGVGFFYTYRYDDGAWQVATTTQLTGTTAQTNCCQQS